MEKVWQLNGSRGPRRPRLEVGEAFDPLTDEHLAVDAEISTLSRSQVV